MITLDGISKTYGNYQALQSIDLSINNGEFIAILGPSGCGKTTLLKLLAGFMSPTSGRMIMNEQLIATDKKVTPPEKRNIGMVFQSFALWPHMNVQEHVRFPLKHHRYVNKGLSKNHDKRITDILHLVGLEKFAKRYPEELSGGQKQRVALARALAPEPSLLLMDEPLSALDAELRMDMRKEIQHIHRETKATIMYVTHDQSEALGMADRIVVMNNGRIEQIGSPETIYLRPETEFVATFVGKNNLIKGKWMNQYFIPDHSPAEKWSNLDISPQLKKKNICPIRPEQWRLSSHGQGMSGKITTVQYQGKEIHYTIQVGEERITAHDNITSGRYSHGDTVKLSIRNPESQTEMQYRHSV
ncbi:ABC transporter ATP-binding protein [Lederbergia lenta]|nr:ABC transporter ATP-binding protein [Lederbergia lenta]MCM3111760.1 ABC transporter ATP-binding protein [Lederbergia lenta]MEC2322914.1 ABC transporter ATP-binding protein [Lederbergia lenta]